MHHTWKAKVPVFLVLLFAINLLVVIALEILLFYPVSLPLTEEALAESDSRYESCTITRETERSGLHCFLVKTADGETHMIPLRSHGLAYSRAKLLKKYITHIPEDQEITIPVKIGVHTSHVLVTPEPLPYMEDQEPAELYIAIDYYGSTNLRTTTTLYMVIAAVLEGLELALFQLIRRED
ncbi:MAG: hypothetical protein IJE81_02620 [Oscillospiraceae bacterium]|nr:hypothetical protein [Oscillospiraceae bacterium]MBQ7130733.1 hypothetical protein [Oscillospiraceae bacterium]